MVSVIEKAKRALVAVILYLANAYGQRVTVTRDSTDTDVSKAYRTLSRKVHPDRGGNTQDQAKLNNAYDVWQDALKSGLTFL